MNTRNVLVCKWGMMVVCNSALLLYVDFPAIMNIINQAMYINSIWLFKSLPEFFKSGYVLHTPFGVKSKHVVDALISAFEEKEGLTLSQDKKDEIMQAAKDSIVSNKAHKIEIQIED